MRVRVRSDALDLIYPPAIRHIHVKSFVRLCSYIYSTDELFIKFTILHGTQRFFTVFAISPLMFFVLSQLNPVHTFRYYFLKMYFNIILQFMNKFDIHGSVHRRLLSKNTNKMQIIFYSEVF
jgi:hypothetical protein